MNVGFNLILGGLTSLCPSRIKKAQVSQLKQLYMGLKHFLLRAPFLASTFNLEGFHYCKRLRLKIPHYLIADILPVTIFET